MGVWRERMRSHADAGYVHVIVNEGQAGRRVAAPHPRADLRAAVRAQRGRARARALHRLPRPHTGPQPARRSAPGGGQRRERLVAVDAEAVRDLPVRLARAVSRPDRAACGRAPVRGRRPARRRAPARRARGGSRPRSATCRRSTSGSAPRRAARQLVLLADRPAARAWRTRPAWRWAPACSCACSRPSAPPSVLRDARTGVIAIAADDRGGHGRRLRRRAPAGRAAPSRSPGAWCG